MSAYTRQKAKGKYRDCIRLERASQEKSNSTNKTPYDQSKQCWEHKRINATAPCNGARTHDTLAKIRPLTTGLLRPPAAGAVEITQVDDEIASILAPDCVRSSFIKTHSAAASARFTTTFVKNPFGHK
ncbi:uncharacterized protein TNCV_2947761 [Trichonephila clavipes]|nr:uncharacterized protein TNCV_2947761 [Trichonephila clavipes]